MERSTADRGSADLRGAAAHAASASFRIDVLEGLGRRAKAIPSRWLYDARGSQLFREIMGLRAYYPTRAEQRILDRHAPEITSPLAGTTCTVVDLGAGDGAKTRLLLDALCGGGPPPRYAPVDVSAAALAQAGGRMASAFPGMEILPVQAEYLDGLRALGTRRAGPLLVLFLGSSVGNLELPEAVAFLRSLRRWLRPGDHVLIGLDLLKDVGTLHAAYDDADGVTAAFNLNLLERMNRELDGDLDVRAFEHVATFDPSRPAMESWLRSRRRQRVRVAGTCFSLEAGERIHTEISCKYRERDGAALARTAGFEEVAWHGDGRHRFADALWRVGASR